MSDPKTDALPLGYIPIRVLNSKFSRTLYDFYQIDFKELQN